MTEAIDDFAGMEDVLEPHAPQLPAVTVPVYDLDKLRKHGPRARFDACVALLEANSAAEAAFRDSCRSAYFAELERVWRERGNRKKRFNVAQAERDLGQEAEALALLYRTHAGEGSEPFRREAERIRQYRTEAANECEIVPASTSWYYRDAYVDAYRTQPGAERYARVRIELHAAELDAIGVRYEIKRHDSNGLPYFALYAFVDESCIPVLKARDGLPLAELVRLSWAKGANPRVYWPSLPHGYEERNGFDQFGRLVAAKKSEPAEPEPI